LLTFAHRETPAPEGPGSIAIDATFESAEKLTMQRYLRVSLAVWGTVATILPRT
jgi:hypothetical protein